MKKTADISLLERSHIYFIGIGGIGMSALARYFHAKGKIINGYDKTPSPLTDEMIREGMHIHFEDHPDEINASFKNKENTLVVYTPAIPNYHRELQFFRQNGFQVLKRSEVLGSISQHLFTVAIAGTHGKTTTSSILTHILRQSGRKFLAFVGGINQNSNSNVLVQEGAEIMITEADEYDRSFLALHPNIALITSIDADHLDIYGNEDDIKGTYVQFSELLSKDDLLITTSETAPNFQHKNKLTYSITNGSYSAQNIHISKGAYQFNIQTPKGRIDNCTLGMPGRHNLENALGAVAIAQHLSIGDNHIKNALSSYKGVKRRFEIHINTEKLVYVDDYAHHPNEISACLESIKELFPGKKITGIFQPHLYTRTRDFSDEFAKSLSLLDELILLQIYPAREEPIEGVSSKIIYDNVHVKEKDLVTKEEVTSVLKEKQIEVLVTMGAGDIDRLIDPIKKLLTLQYA